MKKRYIFILLIVTLYFLSGCEFNKHNSTNNDSKNNVEISRTNFESKNNTITDINTNLNTNIISNNNSSNNEENKATSPVETELASFSTTILDKTENRQHNIKLTCSKLNNLTINSKETFSFLNMLGETSESTRI